ncbi:MAG: cell division ATP-binding protein FtsE [Oligoflexia bacterium]|nr:cell division ATP-binding protein FtsE [Oligoflexia bacterium]
MIDLSHVYKTYPTGVHALSDVSLSIGKGEFVYLTGPSGAGKTTLFKLITCYDQATSGKIVVNGFDYNSIQASAIPFIRRRIGVVFQDFKLLKDRTISENVGLPLEILGVHRTEIQSRVLEALDQVGLKYKGTYFPDHLSGGEQQRVAIARAIINKPGLLIADEPTGNLDQHLADEIMKLFEKINAQGTTVFIATHNTGFLSKGSRRVVRLVKGHVEESPQDRANNVDPMPSHPAPLEAILT